MTPTPMQGARRLARLALPALFLTAGVFAAGVLAGCDLTVDDPNATTKADAFDTRAGLLAAAAGLQRDYNGTAYGNLVLTTGATSRELAANNSLATCSTSTRAAPASRPTTRT